MGINVTRVVIAYLDDPEVRLIRDLGEVPWTSAPQSFDAAQGIIDPVNKMAELRVGNGHLRDTYNTLVLALHRDSKNVLDKKQALERTVEVAALVSVIHKSLGDGGEPVRSWREKALAQFGIYEPYYREWARENSYHTVRPSGGIQVGGYDSFGTPSFARRKFSESDFSRYMDALPQEKRRLLDLLDGNSIPLF